MFRSFYMNSMKTYVLCWFLKWLWHLQTIHIAACTWVSSYFGYISQLGKYCYWILCQVKSIVVEYSVKWILCQIRILCSFKFVNPIHDVLEINNDGHVVLEDLCGLPSDDIRWLICVLEFDGVCYDKNSKTLSASHSWNEHISMDEW